MPLIALILGQGTGFKAQTKQFAGDLATLRNLPQIAISSPRILNPGQDPEVPSLAALQARLARSVQRTDVEVVEERSAATRVLTDARIWLDVNAFRSKVTGDIVYSMSLKVDRLARISATGGTSYVTVWDMNTVGRAPVSEARDQIAGAVDGLVATFAKQWREQNRERDGAGTR